MLSLLSWNIRASQTAAQIAHLTEQKNVDVLVLTEYRQLMRDDRLSAALAEAGWMYQHTPVKVPKVRGVLIASKHPLQLPPLDTNFHFGSLITELSPYIARVLLPDHNITLIGIYMPYADGPAKETLWASLNSYARANPSGRYIITGDVNSCVEGETEGLSLYTPRPLKEIRALTIDAWGEMARRKGFPDRERYTWYSNTKYGQSGIRLDYAFLSPSLHEHLSAARHDHAVRLQGLSDHSALYVDLTL